MLSRYRIALVLFCLFVTTCCRAETPRQLSEKAHWPGRSPKSPEAFSFVIVSDRTGGHVPGEWEAAVKEVNLLQPDFRMLAHVVVDQGRPTVALVPLHEILPLSYAAFTR